MRRLDVIFYESFAAEEAALRRHLGSGVRALFTDEVLRADASAPPPAPLVSIRTQSRIPPAWQGALLGVLTRSTGYDHLVPLLDSMPGLPLAALPEYCTRAVAEQAMLLWTALLRRLPDQCRQVLRFDREGLTGRECAGRRIAVAGVGRIGYEIVRIARALEMQVVGIDLVQRHEDVDYAAPAEALGSADVVVCAMNLTAENRGYFSEARLGEIRRDAVFINVARGELSPPGPLLHALQAGHLSGVALDVYDDEDQVAAALRSAGPSSLPEPWATLFAHPRFLATPHNAFNTEEGVERKAAYTAEQVLNLLQRGRFRWPLTAAGSR